MGPLVPPAKGDKQQRVRVAPQRVAAAFFIFGPSAHPKSRMLSMAKSPLMKPCDGRPRRSLRARRLLSRTEVLEIVGVTYPTLVAG